MKSSFFLKDLKFVTIKLQVKGDETQVLQSVLECDTERENLLQEERKLLALSGYGRHKVF